MRYQGSKLRTADALADFLVELVEIVDPPRVEEIFCGSAAVSRELFRRGLTVAALGDARPALIACYRRVRDDWSPPTSLTREEYAAIREAFPDDTATDPLAAFALIFCSHGGAWAGGYIADDLRWSGAMSGGASRSAAARAHRDLTAMRALLRRTTLWCGDYRERDAERPPGSVIYADPPYAGTKPYKGRGKFDHAAFWAWAEEASHRHYLLVSEDIVPPGWASAVEVLVQSPGLRRAQRLERAFVLEAGLAGRIIRAHPQVPAFTRVAALQPASRQGCIFTV